MKKQIRYKMFHKIELLQSENTRLIHQRDAMAYRCEIAEDELKIQRKRYYELEKTAVEDCCLKDQYRSDKHDLKKQIINLSAQIDNIANTIQNTADFYKENGYDTELKTINILCEELGDLVEIDRSVFPNWNPEDDPTLM